MTIHFGRVFIAMTLCASALAGCSGGVSVPAVGSTASPSAPSSPIPTSSASSATPTGTLTPGMTAAPTSTPTASSTSTPPGPATPGPTQAPTMTPTSPPATMTPTTPPTSNGMCPASFPASQPVTTTTPWPSNGGSLTGPPLGDESYNSMIPSNNASSGTTSTQEASQTTFTDLGGNGPIPTPPPGQTAVRYSSAFELPAQSITFNSSIITLTASAPCEITAGHTYVVYVYANGGGLSHSELSPTTGTTTTQSTNSSGNIVLTFTLDLSKNSVPNFQPENTGTETVIAQK